MDKIIPFTAGKRNSDPNLVTFRYASVGPLVSPSASNRIFYNSHFFDDNVPRASLDKLR